jgi:small subunit ribosomal protein S20
VNYLANIKSAKKRINVTNKRYMRNKSVKSSTKTAIKKVVTAAAAGDMEMAKAAYINAASAIDKAASKGVYHKNTASRRKSRLAKMLNRTAAAL